MSEEFMNRVTLEYLLNKDQYKKHMLKKHTKLNIHDKKFYRKRIFSLTKELLSSKDDAINLLSDINIAFDNYVNCCVDYFKNLDNNDIIQEEYKELEDLNKLNKNSKLDVSNIELQEEADKLLMRTIKIARPTLDKYVEVKYAKKTEEIILPKKKDINLSDPKFKIKGVLISDKKKNITNKYDENNPKKKTLETTDKNYEEKNSPAVS